MSRVERHGSAVAVVALLGALAIGGCDDRAVICRDAPLVTYENFGAGFVTANCQPCHASTAPNRQEAPEDVTFDSLARIGALSNRMLEAATGDRPIMPPAGGVTDDERYLLEVWLRCWAAE